MSLTRFQYDGNTGNDTGLTDYHVIIVSATGCWVQHRDEGSIPGPVRVPARFRLGEAFC